MDEVHLHVLAGVWPRLVTLHLTEAKRRGSRDSSDGYYSARRQNGKKTFHPQTPNNRPQDRAIEPRGGRGGGVAGLSV